MDQPIEMFQNKPLHNFVKTTPIIVILRAQTHNEYIIYMQQLSKG